LALQQQELDQAVVAAEDIGIDDVGGDRAHLDRTG
jgi:hypothetical protein